jgi:hypothetical protein
VLRSVFTNGTVFIVVVVSGLSRFVLHEIYLNVYKIICFDRIYKHSQNNLLLILSFYYKTKEKYFG